MPPPSPTSPHPAPLEKDSLRLIKSSRPLCLPFVARWIYNQMNLPSENEINVILILERNEPEMHYTQIAFFINLQLDNGPL